MYTVKERKPSHGEEIVVLNLDELYGNLSLEFGTVEYSQEPDNKDCGVSLVYDPETPCVPGWHVELFFDSVIMEDEDEYILPCELIRKLPA